MSARRILEQIDHRLEIIETILHLRDPGGARSAEVFEGLRDRVEAIAGERRRHLLDLVELHRELLRKTQSNATGATEILPVVEQMLSREGVRSQGKEGDKFIPKLFEVLGSPLSGPGVIAQVHAPAYVDSQTGEVLSQGRVEVVGAADPSEQDVAR